MKTYKPVLVATALVLMLAWSAVAGEIHTNGVVSPPPPPPDSATATVAANPETEAVPVESESILTDIAINLINLLTVL